MRENTLKKTLKSGGVALGTLMWDTYSRGVLHTLAQAGMDFVMICTEHSGIDYHRVCELASVIVDTRNALNEDTRNGSRAKIVRL